MKRYIEWVIRYRIAIFVITFLMTVMAIYQAKNLKVIIDMNATLPQSHPYIATTNQVEKVFGSKYVVVIGVTPKAGDIYQKNVLEKVAHITTALLKVPGLVPENLLSLSARRAKNIVGTGDGLEVRALMPSVPESAEQMNALRHAVISNPVYLNSIVSNNAKTTAILAEFKEPVGGFNTITRQVDDIVNLERDASVEINIGGLPSYLATIETYSARMGFLIPISIIVLSIILLMAFRTRQGLILPLASAILALIWGLGMMGAAGVPLDAFNATTPFLILAVATGHAVQMLKRYYEEYAHLRLTSKLSAQEANVQAVVTSFMRVAPVMFAAGSVACFGFFSLMVFEITTVRTFGFFTGAGILAVMVVEFTFVTALRSILRPPKEAEGAPRKKPRIWGRATETISNLVTAVSRSPIYIGFALFTILVLVGMNRIVVDNAIKSFFAADTQVAKEDSKLTERLGGTNTLYLLVEGSSADALKDPKTLEAMDRLQQLLAQESNVSKTISIADFVKRMNQAMHGDDPQYFTIPKDPQLVSQYLLLYSMSGEPGDFNSYVDYDYRMANLTVYLKTDSSAYVEKLIEKITRFSDKNFDSSVKVRFGGSVTQGAALSKVMVRGKILNILQIAAVVFLVSTFIFRSLIAGLLVLLPLAIAVLANFGLMGWSGIPLNIPTSLTSAMAVGIGADYAIYLIYRLREELAAGTSEIKAVRNVIKTAGEAILFVAIAVAAGYGVLLFSVGFNIHKWLAILIASAMLVSALTALLLIPALILTFRPNFIFKSRFEKTNLLPASVALIMLAMGLSAQPQNGQAAELNIMQIMEKNVSVNKVGDSTADSTFTLINKDGQERVRKTLNITKLQSNGVDNMRMTRFLAPADVKGTVSLLNEHSDKDDDIWIFLPALKKVRRLVSSNKRDSFVGTDFSYTDVIGYKVNEWNYKLLREEMMDGNICYVIESTPKNAAVLANTGYSKRVDWIRKDNFVSVKSEMADDNAQPLKTMRFADIRLVDEKHGKWQAMHLEANNVQTGHRTLIQLENLKVNQQVADDFFTTRYMEKE